jgi:hypothetical protein
VDTPLAIDAELARARRVGRAIRRVDQQGWIGDAFEIMRKFPDQFSRR